MSILILAKNGRGEATVIGVEKNETEAHKFARASVADGRVSEVYCIQTSIIVTATAKNPEGEEQGEAAQAPKKGKK